MSAKLDKQTKAIQEQTKAIKERPETPETTKALVPITPTPTTQRIYTIEEIRKGTLNEYIKIKNDPSVALSVEKVKVTKKAKNLAKYPSI